MMNNTTNQNGSKTCHCKSESDNLHLYPLPLAYCKTKTREETERELSVSKGMSWKLEHDYSELFAKNGLHSTQQKFTKQHCINTTCREYGNIHVMF